MRDFCSVALRTNCERPSGTSVSIFYYIISMQKVTSVGPDCLTENPLIKKLTKAHVYNIECMKRVINKLAMNK